MLYTTGFEKKADSGEKGRHLTEKCSFIQLHYSKHFVKYENHWRGGWHFSMGIFNTCCGVILVKKGKLHIRHNNIIIHNRKKLNIFLNGTLLAISQFAMLDHWNRHSLKYINSNSVIFGPGFERTFATCFTQVITQAKKLRV